MERRELGERPTAPRNAALEFCCCPIYVHAQKASGALSSVLKISPARYPGMSLEWIAAGVLVCCLA
jgi:hypothetical protein